MDKISEKIKAARIAKGVTIEEVAEATLLSVNIIKDIEDGAFERFVGDELYVKMYLKKIARYLEIDETIADDYYAITREIKKADLKDLENKKEDIGSVTFVDKVKNIQPTKKQQTRKGVYEDHYILRYVKYAIVIIIVIAIIIVLGYSFVFTKSNDSSFKNSNTSKTETSETLKKKTTETDKKKTTKSDTTKKDEQTSTEITFTKNADGDYSFKLPDGYDQETFKLKVDFTFATRVDLHVNGDPNSYQTDTFKRGVYSGSLAPSMSDALKDDSACESVELEFNVNDFQYLEFSYSWNIGHRYYINDQKLPLEESDHNNTIKTFKLTMVK
ncbi:helix-turn-helix domain-containing protein [Faecalibacillus intestinalis]|uniref:helix-turn-helix domain-containing protein n=1 Tax=Faecalibacillus intestinalis TaxID=1982626 RepID=UPI0022DFEF53|nr:helix-turn-helix transcriptional regulator [Faecalibacillus intestinalis]